MRHAGVVVRLRLCVCLGVRLFAQDTEESSEVNSAALGEEVTAQSSNERVLYACVCVSVLLLRVLARVSARACVRA